MEGTDSDLRPHAGTFATTHWSVVVAAAQPESPQSREALEQLCQAYWPPLYAYVRRQGFQPAEAEDLTQEFFARLLERNYIGHADPACGRFRTFLLTSLKRFLVSDWRRSQRQKRSRQAVVSLDALKAGRGDEAANDVTPEELFEQRWALTLMERVLALLQEEYSHAGKRELFDQLKGCVWGERVGASYTEIARSLGRTEGMIKVSVHRLRHRCRDLLRAEIAKTVLRPEEIDDELHHLLTVFGR